MYLRDKETGRELLFIGSPQMPAAVEAEPKLGAGTRSRAFAQMIETSDLSCHHCLQRPH